MSFKLVASAVLATSAVLLGLYLIQSSSRPFSAQDLQAFQDFKAKHQKTYATVSENAFRFRVFRENLRLIQEYREKHELTFSLGVNKFADLSYAEFSNQYLMEDFARFKSAAESNCKAEMQTVEGEPAAKVDWAAQGKVQKVKNQGQCGSCWAFSTIGSMESAYGMFSKNQTLPNLSEQELVDCSKSYGNEGCNGGIMSLGFQYIIDHGVHEESAYPYKGVDQSCKTSWLFTPKYSVKDCVMVGSNTDALTKAIAVQPVSVAFHVNIIFQFYTGGIINPYFCNGQPNHGVLAVGYDLDQKFYKVKNSWGADWGEQGYFRIEIGSGKGSCDIAGSGASVYPLIDTN